ncbi:MAG: hypothetical protein LBB22_06040 [Treponema sp.]|jgi:hypothetical protein|nr:hypothetical protein [Treponema sp.]
MRKFAFLGTILVVLLATTVWSQESDYTIEDALQILESDFSKYGWAHIYYSRKIHDESRISTKVKIVRQIYDSGEIITMQIFYENWRYEIKLNFITDKQVYARRSYDVKQIVFHTLDDLVNKEKVE